MYEIIKNVILTRNYNAEGLVNKIETFWVQERLTDEQREELIQLAYENAKDMDQVNILAKIADLERRVFALENPVEENEPVVAYPVYETGMIIEKGQTVQFDYDEDGNLDLLRYDGGRATTTLAPGKITGWNVVDSEGNVLGSFFKGVFTPAESQE